MNRMHPFGGKGKRLAAAVCALAMLLSGCSGAFDKEYRYEEPYEDEYTALKSDASVQEVKNYVGMKYALLNLVNNAAEYGVIQVREYSGSLEDDVSKACFEVSRESPMGIYAVDFVTHNINQIVSYYEITVYITYKRTPEEIANVVTIHSSSEMQTLLEQTLENLDSTLTVMQVSTTVDEEMIRDYVDGFYRLNPSLLLEKPQLEVNTYAGSKESIQKITELKISYTHSREVLQERKQELRGMTVAFSAGNMPVDLKEIRTEIMDRAKPSVMGTTAYDALIAPRSASSEGYAMAVKLLCASVGLECYVVKGLYNGKTHYWNIVQAEGGYRHIDVFEDDRLDRDSGCLVDSDMWGSYWWDISLYPACEAPEITGGVPGEPAENSAEPGAEEEENDSAA